MGYYSDKPAYVPGCPSQLCELANYCLGDGQQNGACYTTRTTAEEHVSTLRADVAQNVPGVEHSEAFRSACDANDILLAEGIRYNPTCEVIEFPKWQMTRREYWIIILVARFFHSLDTVLEFIDDHGYATLIIAVGWIAFFIIAAYRHF